MKRAGLCVVAGAIGLPLFFIGTGESVHFILVSATRLIGDPKFAAVGTLALFGALCGLIFWFLTE